VQDFGVSAALVTPFRELGTPDLEALAFHAESTLTRGADGITLFGTTGEGASIGAIERQRCLDAIGELDIDADRIVVGLCATSVEDLLAQARAADDRGIARFLLPPPFYYKGIDDASLFEWFANVFTRLSTESETVLYHIPQVTEVPLSLDLVRRLRDAYPSQAVAVKDSSGDWKNTRALLDEEGLAVLVGYERHLARATRLGCVGSISGLANVVPKRVRRVLDSGVADPELDVLVDAVTSIPVTPAVKVLVSVIYGDERWRRVRPPLASTPDEHIPRLASALSAATGSTGN
jgi:4-hydroxy-tetrahydrodipicolinate synthase